MADHPILSLLGVTERRRLREFLSGEPSELPRGAANISYALDAALRRREQDDRETLLTFEQRQAVLQWLIEEYGRAEPG